MSEHPVIKHAIRSYNAWKAPGVRTRQKVWEIAIEIMIIIFAITLSLMLERWREHASEKKLEKDFLAGCRKDLLKDIGELKADSAGYYNVFRAFEYFSNNRTYNNDSAKQHLNWLYNTTEFIPNLSRYEALKSSGKLDVVSNNELLDDIVSFYQESTPFLRYNTESFSSFKTRYLVPYLDEHLTRGAGNLEQVLHSDIVSNYLKKSSSARNITQIYHQLITQAKRIVSEINSELDKH